MDTSLSGKTALITGGSLGLGLAMAKSFYAEGAKVAIIARRQEPIGRAVQEIKSLSGSGSVLGVSCDVTDIASLEQMQQFSKGFETFADSHKDMVAQAYLGRQVNIQDDGKSVTGIVDAVNKAEDGKVTVQVKGKDYNPENISRVFLSGVSDQ